MRLNITTCKQYNKHEWNSQKYIYGKRARRNSLQQQAGESEAASMKHRFVCSEMFGSHEGESLAVVEGMRERRVFLVRKTEYMIEEA